MNYECIYQLALSFRENYKIMEETDLYIEKTKKENIKVLENAINELRRKLNPVIKQGKIIKLKIAN